MNVRSLSREDPLEEEMAPTPVFLPGETHAQRRLAGYSPKGCKQLDMAEQLTAGLRGCGRHIRDRRDRL